MGTLVRYGAGQTGGQLFRDTPAALLPVFMTTMLGVPAWLAGVAILLPKLWVIICDPLMGAWSDRLRSRYGRTPFLAAGAVLSGIGFFALFAFTGFTSPVVAAAYVSLIFLLASTGFSAFSVPYLAIASELSDDTHERTRLLAARVLFSIGGVIIGVGVAQPLVFALGGGQHGWRVMGAALGAICLATMLFSAVSLRREPRVNTPTTEPRGLMLQLVEAWRNREFRLLIITFLIQSIGQAVQYSVIGFFFVYGVGNIGMILPFVLCMACGSTIAQPFWIGFSRRFGKTTSFITATLGWCAVTLTLLLITPNGPVLLTLPFVGPLTEQNLWMMARALPLSICNVGFVLFAMSILTDIIDRTRTRQGGHADEGMFSGIFSATEKLSFAIGPTIAGVILSAAGFLSSTHGVTTQSDSAIWAVRLLYGLVPALIIGASLIPFRVLIGHIRQPASGASVSPGATPSFSDARA